ncbi:MAG: acyl--CoA ligase [Clostridiales bacterium]|nr:acyl--CoA ligase [Clostridiales bacterium]
MNTTDNKTTGYPSIDRPWMKYYPPQISQMQIPECTMMEYLRQNCPGEDVVAMHYYGEDILWSTVFENIEDVARSLKAMGFGEGDQIPVFLHNVPQYIYLLLAAEKIGASLLCRDNTLQENVEAVNQSGAKAIFAHDYLKQHELDAYLSDSHTERAVLVSPLISGSYDAMPDYIQAVIDGLYSHTPANGSRTMNWNDFLALGESYDGVVDAPADCNRPLLRAYTSGSTGPSKQVIHSAHTMIGVIHQMNFYGSQGGFRASWMVTCLPPCLVAVVVAMDLMPLASDKYLILNPYCGLDDVDLEMMRYRPNCWPLLPLFADVLVNSERIPDDYDMSHLFAAGVGCESYNNGQLARMQKFMNDHKCQARLTVGYGCSESGSNVSLPMTPHPIGNGNSGVPLPLTTISVFKAGTDEELTYNQFGEICISGPGLMLGYDNPEATADTLKVHKDGMTWLHTKDIGYMNEDGVVYVLTRGHAPRFGGGDMATFPMENRLADAKIEGIKDEFFVLAPDHEHDGCFLPYLFVVLEDGYTTESIEDSVRACLDPYMYPVSIFTLPQRPFYHFKTNRLGMSRELHSFQQAACA